MKWVGILFVLSVVLVIGSKSACFAVEVDAAAIANLREQIMKDVLHEIERKYHLVPREEAVVKPEEKYVTEVEARQIVEQAAVEQKPIPKEEAIAKPVEKYLTEDEVRQVVEEVAEEKKFVTYEWGKGLTFGGLTQRLTLQGFGDVTFRTNEGGGRFDGEEDNNFFALGGLDLFLTSQISERISFLSETLIEIEEDEIELDVERLFIKYLLSDYLQITVGRVHTALGYWNEAFHHGTWLQTTIDRPDVYAFEHDGGILPVHAVGIELSGAYDFGPFDLEYIFNIVNGRSETVDEIQNVSDRNDSKATGLKVTAKPEILPGLFFGGNFYLDDIPEKSDAPIHGKIDEIILGAHAGYLYSNWEFLLEGFNVNHDDNDITDREYNTWGAYAQLAYTINKWKPYYRYDIVQFDKRDPFYSTSFDEPLSDVKRHTFGIRYDLTTYNAIKAEYNHLDASDGGNVESFGINTSFAF